MAKEYIGIWIDRRGADFIKIQNGTSSTDHLESLIDEGRPKGGSRSNVPYGPVDTVSESKFLEKRIHQEDDFFDRIIEQIGTGQRIIIFGPAQMKDKLNRRIQDKAGSKLTVDDVLQADSMTLNQKAAFVRDYYQIEH